MSESRADGGRLRVTLLALNFAPEPTGSGPYAAGLAAGLAEHHDVTVIAGQPHYPQWSLLPGYGDAVTTSQDGYTVRRVKHHVPSTPSNLGRLRMETSYGWHAVRAAWGTPDVVLCLSPSLFGTAAAVTRIRRGRRRPPVGIWVHDLYSVGAKETETVGGMAARMAEATERRVLAAADGVAVIHDHFRRAVTQDLGVDPARIETLRVWTHIRMPEAVDTAAARRRFGWRDDDLIVLHAGNMGLKQGLGNVVEAAREADRRGSRVRFVLVGDGRQRPELEQQAAGIERVQFVPTLDDADFTAALGAADVLLVNELAGVSEMALPSKLTSYFAAGRPVLAAVSADGATAAELTASDIGEVVRSGDPAALLAAAEHLALDRARGEALAARALTFCRTQLDRDAQMAAWDRWVRRLARPHDVTLPADTRQTGTVSP